MARKDDVDDTMAAFSEMIAQRGWEPMTAIPIKRDSRLLYVTMDTPPTPDLAFAVDKTTGVEATLSESNGDGSNIINFKEV